MRKSVTLTIDTTILAAASEKSLALNVDLEASDYITTPIIYIADDSIAALDAEFVLDRLPNESDENYAERERAYKLMCKP